MGRTIHIVYDVRYPSVEGGGQKRIYEIARRLKARGWNVQWYTFKTWDQQSSIEIDGIEYVGLSGYVSLYGKDGRRSWREALAFGRAVWMHRRAIRDADILWCGQWPYSHLLMLLHTTRARVYVDWWEIWGRHWFEYFSGPVGLVGYTAERILARACSRWAKIIAISPRGARQLVEAGANPASVCMIPNGIDMRTIEAIEPADAATDVIYVGRLKDHKNVDHIIRAVYLLRTRYGIDLRVDILGSGPEENSLRSLAKSLGLGSQIRFRGAVDERTKYAHIKSASVFVHPSIKEGGGSLTVHEAQACGTPVMIYDTPQGIDSEYILEDRTGWLVNRADPEALAECLATLVRSDSLKLRSKVADCRAAALEHDWEQIADRYHRIFQGT